MDSQLNSATLPRIVIARPSGLRGTAFVLTADRLLLGRGSDCDLRLDEPHISATHAAFLCSSAQTTVQDLGSTNGTLVNGDRIAGTRVLRHGDLLLFGTVEARYEEPAVARAQTAKAPQAVSRDARSDIAAALRVAPAGRHLRSGSAGQPAAELSNGAGGQAGEYSTHVEHVIAQQASFLRQVSATGARARRFFAIGFVVFALGTGMIAGLVLRLAAQVNNVAATGTATRFTETPVPSIFGPVFHGVPVGAIGLAAAFIGLVVMIVGIVPHLAATARLAERWNDPSSVAARREDAETRQRDDLTRQVLALPQRRSA